MDLTPHEKKASHGFFVKWFLVAVSGLCSFLFVVCLLVGANIYHLKDLFSGREKLNKPQLNSGTNYTPREPFPDVDKMKITKDLRYYAQLLKLDLEEHEITTEDGYILVLHRLVDPLDSAEKRLQKPPILMQHGLLSCSGAWLAPGRNSLPFYFMERGYDVWLGNNRCGFNPRHVSEKHPWHLEKFWDWDVRVFAFYDLPCIIDNVLAHKPHEKLVLMGHLQGCTQLFLLLANEQLHKYHAQIEHFVALAPAIFPGLLFYDRRFIKFIHNRLPWGYKTIFGHNCFIPFLGTTRNWIGTTRLYSTLLYQMFKYLFGWNIRNCYKNDKVLHLQFLMNVSYVSSRLMSWWLLYLVDEGFSNQLQPREDYMNGTTGSFTPYSSRADETARIEDMNDLSLFPYKKAWFNARTVPITMFPCGEDYLVDGTRLASHMEHYEPSYKVGENLTIVNMPTYNHLDVIWARDVIGTIGEVVVQSLQGQSEKQVDV